MARWGWLLLMLWTGAAGAVDGCRALLCFAYPGDPRSLPACAATVSEVLDLLARGGSFPRCDAVATPGAPGVVTGTQRYFPCAQSYGAPWTDAAPGTAVRPQCVARVSRLEVDARRLPAACATNACRVAASAAPPGDGLAPVDVLLPAQPTPAPNFIDVVLDPGHVQRFWWTSP